MILTESSHCRTTWTDTHCPSCCFHTSVNSFTILINWLKSEKQKDCFEYYKNSFFSSLHRNSLATGKRRSAASISTRNCPTSNSLSQNLTWPRRLRSPPGASWNNGRNQKAGFTHDTVSSKGVIRSCEYVLLRRNVSWEMSSKQDKGRFLAWCFPMLFFAKLRFLPGFHKNTNYYFLFDFTTKNWVRENLVFYCRWYPCVFDAIMSPVQYFSVAKSWFEAATVCEGRWFPRLSLKLLQKVNLNKYGILNYFILIVLHINVFI